MIRTDLKHVHKDCHELVCGNHFALRDMHF